MLTPIADQLWGVEHDHFMPGGIHFRGRMTVARLSDGTLWLHSAIPIDDALAKELTALGPVAHVVIPSFMHDLHGAAAAERFGAALWGPPGMAARKPELSFAGELTNDAVAPWSSEIGHVFVAGAERVSEVVFFHQASKSLICTDLVFNIHEWQNAQTGLLLWLIGCRGTFNQSRSWRFVFTSDHTAAAVSVRGVLAWPIERVIPAHGAVVTADASSQLARALNWMRSG